jgi:alpha-L-rhamnosidase
LHDLGVLVEMASGIGDTATASELRTQRAAVAAAFHKQWFNANKSCYGTCLQTENAFALWTGVVPKELIGAVIAQTVNDIFVTNKMHTTSGIIGIKAMFEAMSRLGRPDVPVLMTQQTSYPSYGYMIHNKYEPATTLWELWNSPSQGPSMNSRNHIMFGSVSSWFYRHLCGIDVPEGSKGYDLVSIRPVGVGVPGANLTSADCSVGTPHGDVKASWKGPFVPASAALTSTEPTVQLSLTLPAGSKGTVRVPLIPKIGLSPSTAVITESASTVWQNGKFVPSVAGVSAAQADGDGVVFTIVSGAYAFSASKAGETMVVI